MKGILTGTNKFPGVVALRQRRHGLRFLAMKKRKLGIHNVPRKKTRESKRQAVKTEVKEGKNVQNSDVEIDGEAHIVGMEGDAQVTRFEVEGDSQIAEVGINDAKAEERLTELQIQRRIVYDGDKATVTLLSNQVVAMDGCAFVRLMEGRAAIHGYFLSPGVDLLLCSNTKLSAVVTIESRPPPGAMKDNVHPEAYYPNIPTSSLEIPANDIESFGCSLEFRSYRGGSTDSESGVDASKQPTFRLEIAGENETPAEHDVEKRRDENFKGRVEEEEAAWSSGDNDEDSLEKARPNLEGQMDVGIDELSEPDNLSMRLIRKETLIELRTPLHPTFIPDSWWAAANSIIQESKADCSTKESGSSQQSCSVARNHRSPIVAVCGAKNAGKSTFARFLLNFLLNSHEAVGYLDTDVGQPEFTVPGCLSLHVVRLPAFGSPVLHLRSPEKSFFYGDVSPKVDPEMYSHCIVSLYDYFIQTYGDNNISTRGDNVSTIPLVINTHGWIKGIGYDVLVDLLRHTLPTHVVQFNLNAENKKLPAGRFWDSSGSEQTNMIYIESALEVSDRPLVKVKMASDHLRNSRIMAYFWQCFSTNALPYPYREEKLFAQIAFSLVRHPPYQVPVSAIKICHLHCQVPKAESFHSINGSMVGLGISSRTLDSITVSSSYQYPSCVGLGIVRGVDAEKGVLFIITPLSVDILQKVDTLLQGRVPIPVPLLQAQGYTSPYLCHNSVAMEGTGSVAMKPCKRFVKVV